MKRRSSLSAALAAVLLFVCAWAVTNSSAQNEAKKSGDDHIKISSNCIELAEVKAEAEKCPQAGEASFVRLRVTCDAAVDVRLYSQNRRGSWAFRDFNNQKRGDEITDYQCFPKARFRVVTRSAGSNEKWPK